MDPTKNFAIVTVSQGYDSTVTSITLSSGDSSKLPDPSTDGNFNLIWWNFSDYPNPSDDPYVEVVRCTDIASGDVLTITRAQESTSASDHNISGKTYKMILGLTKKMMDDLIAYAEAQKAVFRRDTFTGDGTTTTFTLTYSPSTNSETVYVEGVLQDQDSDYSVSGKDITFTTAPANNRKVEVRYVEA